MFTAILTSKLFVTFIGLAGAWGVGNNLSTRWQLIRKRKEMELEAAQSFYETYGEFYAVWKIWNLLLLESKDLTNEAFLTSRAELFSRASAMEGKIEATLLKVVSEMKLTNSDLENLGELRQAFGVIRTCIRKKQPIPFTNDSHPLYKRLKELAPTFGSLLVQPINQGVKNFLSTPKVPIIEKSKFAWKEITHNKHEKNWKDLL